MKFPDNTIDTGLSVCCSYPMRTVVPEKGKAYSECTNCGKPCDTQTPTPKRKELELEHKISILSDIGFGLTLVKHDADIDNGYNADVEFDDESGISLPGKTLNEALDALLNDWRVKANLKSKLRKESE